MNLNIDEKSITYIYWQKNKERNNLIATMRNSLNYVDDPIIKNTMENAIQKLIAMKDTEFNNIDFNDNLCED